MPEAPCYLVAMCEGEACLSMVAMADHRGHDGDGAAARARLEATLAAMATLLRAKGAVGRLVLLNRETGEMIATHQVWP